MTGRDTRRQPDGASRGAARPSDTSPVSLRVAVSPTAARAIQTAPATYAADPHIARIDPAEPTRAGSTERQATAGRGRSLGLPMARLATVRPNSSAYHVITTIDSRGRVADRRPLTLLQWPDRQPITISAHPSAGIVTVRREGQAALTRQGHLRLPGCVRHACHIKGGDRLLLVAVADHDLLVAYTMAALDAMVSNYHAVALRGRLR